VCRGGDHIECLCLAPVLVKVRERTARQRRPVDGDGQHREAVASLQELEQRGLGLAIGAVGAEEEEYAGHLRDALQDFVAVVARLPVGQIRGEGGGGSLG